MKVNITKGILAAASSLALFLAGAAQGAPVDPTTELGAAGPGSLAVLDSGNFSISFNPTPTVVNGQTIILGQIQGNVLAQSVSLSTPLNVNGTVINNPALLASDLVLAANAATYYSGLAANFTSLPAAGTLASPVTLTPGVYNLGSSLSLSGGGYRLTAGAVYVFNVAGTMTVNQSTEFLDTTPQDAIFNVQKLQVSGGINPNPPGESIIEAVVLSSGQISLTPGFEAPELISFGPNGSINIASGGSVGGGGGTPPVPDGGSSMLLMSMGLGLIIAAKKKLVA